ncbi:MAG: nucleotidyl transferase AbiEii/AbiGii toxin family protein [Eubacteriaceae bacterium]|nr:nucleotidyl transferase AbiEii/AbiGii toxin family protein [Eubacteriaceae bacterium]
MSHSKYRDKFVLKGGLLIASMIGVDQRTTMDTTVRGLPVNEELINKILEAILHLPSDDEIVFSLQGLKSIREKNQYEDYYATIFADYGKVHASFIIVTGFVRFMPGWNWRTSGLSESMINSL